MKYNKYIFKTYINVFQLGSKETLCIFMYINLM